MSTLHRQFDALLFDLDGVVYVGPEAVPHAASSIAGARQEGAACGFITNNAARTAEVVAEHLTSIGVPCRLDEVITSPQAAITVLGDFVEPGSRILVIGGPGIADELVAHGYVPVRSLDDAPAAVVQGFSPDLGWRDLAEATFAVRAGLPWIATNPDRTFPTPRGVAPGNGALVGLVAEAAGRRPDAVAGKPEPPLLHEAIGRLSASRPLMIGDRLDTDIAAGARIGIPTLLVLTGVTTVEEVLRADREERPTFIAGDLRVLLAEYPEVVVEGRDSSVARCGGSEVSVLDHRLVVTKEGEPIDVIRAAAGVVWAQADRGQGVDTSGILESAGWIR